MTDHALQDSNQFHTLISSQGGGVYRNIVDDYNNLHSISLSSLIPNEFDSIVTTYPDGTSELYTYKKSSQTVGTIKVDYSDSTKGSILFINNSGGGVTPPPGNGGYMVGIFPPITYP